MKLVRFGSEGNEKPGLIVGTVTKTPSFSLLVINSIKNFDFRRQCKYL